MRRGWADGQPKDEMRGEAARRARWLEFPLAAEEWTVVREERLGRQMFPSYREFLKVSDEWEHAGAWSCWRGSLRRAGTTPRRDSRASLRSIWTDGHDPHPGDENRTWPTPEPPHRGPGRPCLLILRGPRPPAPSADPHGHPAVVGPDRPRSAAGPPRRAPAQLRYADRIAYQAHSTSRHPHLGTALAKETEPSGVTEGGRPRQARDAVLGCQR